MRARRLGIRRASHLIDEERKRSCTGSVHSSGSFCTKLRLLALRTPPSWFAARAPGRMPAARRPEMHHASPCAGTYPQGLRDANGLANGRCGEEASAGFLLRGKQNGIQWSIRPLKYGHRSLAVMLMEMVGYMVSKTDAPRRGHMGGPARRGRHPSPPPDNTFNFGMLSQACE